MAIYYVFLAPCECVGPLSLIRVWELDKMNFIQTISLMTLPSLEHMECDTLDVSLPFSLCFG